MVVASLLSSMDTQPLTTLHLIFLPITLLPTTFNRTLSPLSPPRPYYPQVKGLGPDAVFGGRFGDAGWPAFMAALKDTVTVVVDNCGGAHFKDMLDVLCVGGRYVGVGTV